MKSISSKLYAMVNMPSLNTPTAIDAISDNITAAFPNAYPIAALQVLSQFNSNRAQRLSTALAYAYAVMAKYPRGKGTTKNEALRKLYAASYCIHRANTKHRSDRDIRGPIAALTKTTIAALRAYDPEGAARLDPTTPAKMLKLHDLGLVDGLGEMGWLTDLGIRVVEQLKRNDDYALQVKAVAVSQRLKSLLDGAVTFTRMPLTNRDGVETDVDGVMVMFGQPDDFITFAGNTVPNALALLESMGVPEQA